MDTTTAMRNINRLLYQPRTRRTVTKARYWLHVYNALVNAQYAAIGFPVARAKDAKPRVKFYAFMPATALDDASNDVWDDKSGSFAEDLGNGWDCEPDNDERD